MNEILDFQIVGNSVGSLLLAVGVIVFAFLVRRLVSEVVANFIIRLFTKKKNTTVVPTSKNTFPFLWAT